MCEISVKEANKWITLLMNHDILLKSMIKVLRSHVLQEFKFFLSSLNHATISFRLIIINYLENHTTNKKNHSNYIYYYNIVYEKNIKLTDIQCYYLHVPSLFH